jgi:hypothetical protein
MNRISFFVIDFLMGASAPDFPYSLRSLRSIISFLFISERNGARPSRRVIDCFGLSLRACGAAGAGLCSLFSHGRSSYGSENVSATGVG